MGVGVRRLSGSDSGSIRSPNVALPSASAEAANAGVWSECRLRRPRPKAAPMRPSPRARRSGATLGWGGVGYVGLGRRHRPARGTSQHDDREEHDQRLRQPEQHVGERRADQAEDKDRSAPDTVREAAEKWPADELHRSVEGAEEADQRRASGVLPGVERK